MTAASESLGAWLDGKLESVPQELAVRIRAVLPPDWRSASIADAPSVFTDAASRELRGLLERGCEERWAAPGLLVVDALVTYACELVALSGGDMDAGSVAILNSVVATLPSDESAA
ncbi:MAG TPA: hypothetical protein VN650_14625 [Gemmatimonadaceae bacterium]|nr:hypothetical protein [Gemmatimonadaceae bacterium]